MDTRHISEKYAEIGRKFIDTLPEFRKIKESDATVVFLASDHKKKSGGRKVLGE